MSEEAKDLDSTFMQRNRFMNCNHICIGESGDDWAEAYLDIVPDSTNPYGLVHGGALFTMADCCAGVAARLDGRQYVTQDASVQFIHNVDHGRVIAHGTVLSRGKRVCIVQVRIYDEDKNILFNSSFSMFCIGEQNNGN